MIYDDGDPGTVCVKSKKQWDNIKENKYKKIFIIAGYYNIINKQKAKYIYITDKTKINYIKGDIKIFSIDDCSINNICGNVKISEIWGEAKIGIIRNNVKIGKLETPAHIKIIKDHVIINEVVMINEEDILIDKIYRKAKIRRRHYDDGSSSRQYWQDFSGYARNFG